MRKLFLASICSFCLCVIISFLSFKITCESISDKVIRLHIPANSNTSFDQEIKIKVKEEIFEYLNEILINSESFEESKMIINESLNIIENKANMILLKEGADYKAEALVKENYFNKKEYGDYILPPGEYESLYIKLGSGEGENWFCAIYPSICIPETMCFESFTESEEDIIKEKGSYEISFFFYECYLDILRYFKFI